jgi:hypothetical protein
VVHSRMTPINCVRSFGSATTLAVAFCILACRRSEPHSNFIGARVDRQITGSSKLPVAVDPDRVGTYPADTKSGAGYFYDDVLEYRVWLHPENGAEHLNGDNDYFVAFAQYELAEDFSKKTPGAERPLVLVRQREWIDEPKHGQFIARKEERTTEWQIAWLKGNKRTERSIEEFLKHPYEAGP